MQMLPESGVRLLPSTDAQAPVLHGPGELMTTVGVWRDWIKKGSPYEFA